MNTKELLLRVAELKISIKKAEEELELIQPQALQEVLKLRGDTDSPIELEEYKGYKFSIMKRKTWTYPDYVTEAEKNLKAEKKNAEQTGAATFVEKESLLFTSPKND